MTSLTLYELNNLVRQTLELTLDGEYWLRAEISELHVNKHCYMELVQKDERGHGIMAKARAQVWANRWMLLRPLFERTTGQALSAGLQVLVKVEVTFHELYGYSLNITDIDPSYTMGDIARRRQEIIAQLKAEGIDTMNQELSLPRLLQRIAVISSATAAGYGDFCNQLMNNQRGLGFKTELFQAVMQGHDVESTVIAALNRIAAEMDKWDVVVIIRGGGSTSDLSGFDTLNLAENVAQFPLPIVTGIGHERDDTVIDLIAHTRVKTPTAAAEFLIHHQEEELDIVEDLSARLADSVRATLLTESTRLKLQAGKLPMLFATLKAKEEVKLHQLMATLGRSSLQHIEKERHKAEQTYQRLTLQTPLWLNQLHHRIELLENKLEGASPDRILRLGFSITRLNGKAVKSTDELNEGDEIETTLASGTLKSTITWTKK